MGEERFCTNCRAELPRGAHACTACGVFAGDVFDGTWPRKRSYAGRWLTLLVLAIAVAAAARFYERWSRAREAGPDLPSVRVVADRPGGSRRAAGATVTEAQAIRLLRRHIVGAKSIANDCLVLMGEKERQPYAFAAFDRCASVRLGFWHVDPKSGAPSLMRPE